MKKSKIFVSIILCAAVIISVSFVGDIDIKHSADTDVIQNNNKFRAELTSIYKNYDSDLSDVNKEDEFALKRLIVSDYDGDDYGAADTAINQNHDLAVLQYESENDARSAYEKIKADGHIVDPDGLVTIDEYDKGQMYPLGSNTLGTDTYMKNYAMGYDDVLVAVIDTAVMTDHPDLADRFFSKGYDFSSDGFDNADYKGCLDGAYYHHSTFVSGIIANNTPDNVKILPYKVVENGGSDGTVSAIIASINDAVDNDVDVINLSISSGYGAGSFKKAVDNAVSNGVCLCASAGNKGAEIVSYPSLTPGTITVTALNSTCTGISSYSSFGSCVDFCAPGTSIYSTIPTADGGGYDKKSGTSYSTPYITAVCADVKSINNNFSKDDVYNIICDFAVDYGDEGFDEYYGNGVPCLSDMVYTDGKYYSYSVPQGVLDVYDSVDYTAETQPWSLFADKLVKVNVAENVNSIGAYAFYNMSSADFNMADTYNSIGDYAFYACKSLNSFNFDIDVSYIGTKAFGEIGSDFVINGYRNTPAEVYAAADGITFNSLGCNHNYIMDIIDPTDDTEGYTIYTCSICGDTYTGPYIQPVVISSGQCGESLTYTLYNTGKLNIEGSGDMYDYINEPAPWEEYRENVKIINITSDVASISPYAFYNCSYINEYRSSSNAYRVINKSLYSADGSSLVCAVNSSDGSYTMPDGLTDFNATAFLGISNISIIPNDNFYINSSVIYDKNGNLIMALPSYKSESLTISTAVNVNDYAFILTEYPSFVRVYSTYTEFGKYSLGYHYENGFVKNNLIYYGYVDAQAYQYAVDNGFETNLLNKGDCGENVSWHYNVDNNTLTISGTGDMTKYTSAASVPWYDYMSEIKNIVISNEIGYLSSYAFYNACNVESVVMPLSISAPLGQTTWYGCSNIKKIKLTYGTGYMADYGTTKSAKIYTYTPWYISRDSLSIISIDSDVKYIGAYAFRGCSAIKTITLNDCSSIGKYAFYNCMGIIAFINYSKETSYGSNCLFKYSSENELKSTLYGYSDSTSKDYADSVGCDFVSLGCDHSRGYTSEGERPSCCYDSNVLYYCKDCGSYMYEEYVYAQSEGHYVKAVVKTTSGNAIPDAQVYIDGELAAVTNSSGKFVVDNILCEVNHIVEIKKHGFTIASTVVNTNQSNRSGTLSIKYGNFIADSAVNGKDYAYARKNGFEDIDIMDYGKIAGESVIINTKYSKQNTPTTTNTYVEQSPSSAKTAVFYTDVGFGNEYIITDCGYIYGKNMDDDMLTLENEGVKNAEGFAVKRWTAPINSNTKSLTYSSSTSPAKLSARFYIVYTNGVKTYTYYSDVSTFFVG
ncbi:MAG: S8 family serine peptidase [Eubacterium sp.]